MRRHTSGILTFVLFLVVSVIISGILGVLFINHLLTFYKSGLSGNDFLKFLPKTYLMQTVLYGGIIWVGMIISYLITHGITGIFHAIFYHHENKKNKMQAIKDRANRTSALPRNKNNGSNTGNHLNSDNDNFHNYSNQDHINHPEQANSNETVNDFNRDRGFNNDDEVTRTTTTTETTTVEDNTPNNQDDYLHRKYTDRFRFKK